MFDMKIYVRPSDLELLNKRLKGDRSIPVLQYSTQDIDRLNGWQEITLPYADFMNMKENGYLVPVNL